MDTVANIPMQHIGPVHIISDHFETKVHVPLVTYEAPLWPSTERGARVSVVCGGIRATLIDNRMTRSVVFKGPNAHYLHQIKHYLEKNYATFQKVAKKNSRFAQLIDHHTQVIGRLLYLRLEFETGDAAGHNMATQGADNVIHWLLETFSELTYGAISANICTDKKVSAINGLLGRGKYVIAELVIDRKTCARYLKTTPEKMVELNIQKNLIGSIAAGSLRSANAHYANLLLAIYLATGQDAANIVEGSQGITHCDIQDDQLYFSVTLPNIIVGTVGNGKNLPFVKNNLAMLGCQPTKTHGQSAQRLAIIVAATVLCGELSCLAAQTNPGELISSHLRIERGKGERCA